jgi:hypothetical protein
MHSVKINTVLKILVCGFSFAFTSYFCALLLSLLFVPIAGAINYGGYPVQAAIFAFMPVPLALSAGFQSAKTALRLERERQNRALEKRLARDA